MVDEHLRRDILADIGEVLLKIYYCSSADIERYSPEDIADTLGISRQKFADIINYYLKCQRAEGHWHCIKELVMEKTESGFSHLCAIMSAPEDGRRSRRRRALGR